MFQVQKRSKDIGKIIHVTSVVQPKFYEATRILFVCQENKNNDFVLQFFSSSSHPPSLWRVHDVPLHVNKAQFYINSSSMCIRHGTLYNGGGQSRERRNRWIKTFFSLHTKSILVALWNYGWTTDVTWTILMMSLQTFWVFTVVGTLLSMGGSESSRNF